MKGPIAEMVLAMTVNKEPILMNQKFKNVLDIEIQLEPKSEDPSNGLLILVPNITECADQKWVVPLKKNPRVLLKFPEELNVGACAI